VKNGSCRGKRLQGRRCACQYRGLLKALFNGKLKRSEIEDSWSLISVREDTDVGPGVAITLNHRGRLSLAVEAAVCVVETSGSDAND